MKNETKKADISYLIKKISVLQRSEMDASLSSFNLTSSQLRILFCLDRHEGEMTQKELEEELGVSHPTVVGLVGRLEKQGYITTCVDPADKRHKRILPTAKALDLKEDLEKRRKASEENLAKGLSEEDLDRLNEFLQKIYRNVSGEKGEKEC